MRTSVLNLPKNGRLGTDDGRPQIKGGIKMKTAIAEMKEIVEGWSEQNCEEFDEVWDWLEGNCIIEELDFEMLMIELDRYLD